MRVFVWWYFITYAQRFYLLGMGVWFLICRYKYWYSGSNLVCLLKFVISGLSTSNFISSKRALLGESLCRADIWYPNKPFLKNVSFVSWYDFYIVLELSVRCLFKKVFMLFLKTECRLGVLLVLAIFLEFVIFS